MKLILVCIFKLYDTTSNLVKNTALATLRQLFSIIFENLYTASPNQESSELYETAKELIEGLYCTFDEDYENNPNWPLAANYENRCLALDLYCLCFQSAKENLNNFTEFIDFINDFLVPILQGYLKDLDDYKFGIRLIRCFNFMIQYLQIGIHPLMEFMSNSLDAKPWIKRIAFELFSTLLANPQTVKQIWGDKELLGHLEISLISIQNFLEANKYELDGEDRTESARGIPKFLDIRMIETEKPSAKTNEMMILSIESVTGLVEGISTILFPNGLDTNISIPSTTAEESEESSLVIPFSVSKLILRILSVLLEKSSRDVSIQSILNSIQVYINITGIKGMSKERDSFIRELCQYCASSSRIDDKEILACKTLFNVAH